jgi:hypothetical protein
MPEFENSAIAGILVVDGQSSRSHPSGLGNRHGSARWLPTSNG